MTHISNVTVAGSGVLGSQIAYQSAYSGKNVIIYDINDEAIAKAKDRIKSLRSLYKKKTLILRIVSLKQDWSGSNIRRT